MTLPLLTLEQAAAALSQGKPVVLPTDTVYGVGVAVRAADSPRALFEAKGRPDSKPVAWLVADAGALDKYGADVPAYARELAQTFWPGALTLVVRASDAVPPAFRSADGTIGLRMPASEDALALIRAVDSPLAVTSANISGKEAPAKLEDLDPALVSATAGVLVSQEEKPASPADGTASTVLDCTGEVTRVLRQGSLTFERMKGCLS